VARKRKKTEAPGFDEQSDTASAERERLTPVDIQQKVFRLAFRGYNERDVDEFLDHLTEDLAALHEENKRLREQAAERGPGGGGGHSEQQAEAVVRQAREHAARLMEDAERRVAEAGEAGVGLPGSFLLQERQFLQQMAALIQGHATRLKEEARRARSESRVPVAPEAGQGRGGAVGAVGGSAAGAAAGAVAVGAAATSDEPSEPEGPRSPARGPRSEPPSAEPGGEPPAQEEATAPWSPVEEESGPPSASEDRDPLVSAWESAFSGDETEPAFAEERPREQEGDPSLRELFWGEE
jgi:cell division initiation protein